MNFKIKKTDARYFFWGAFVIISCIQMAFLTSEHNATGIYRLFQVGLLFVFVLLAVPNYGKQFISNKTNIYILLYFAIYTLSCFANHNIFSIVLYSFIRIMCVALIVEAGRRKHCKPLVSGATFSLLMMTVANTITSVLYPNALYANNVGRFVCFLLGEDNASINIYLLTVCIAAVHAYVTKRKMTVWLFISVANVVFFSVTRNIGGGLVCSAVLVVLYFLLWFKEIKLEMKYVLIGMGVFFVTFILLQNFSIFANLITNYLHRDLTLTSRTTLWTQAITLFQEKPILGYGSYYNSSLADTMYGARGIRTVLTPHNTYLANLIAGGILLVGIFIVLLIHMAQEFDSYPLTDKDQGDYRSIISIAWLAMMLHGQIEGSDSEVMLIGILFIMMAIQDIPDSRTNLSYKKKPLKLVRRLR